MKKIVQGLLLLLLLTNATSPFAEEIKVSGFVPKLGFPKTEANPSSYPGYTPVPGEDMGTIGAPALGGLPHFQDNLDGTITDNATGLMWVQNPSLCGGGSYPNTWATDPDVPNTMTWTNAITECEALDYAGHNDWRLPNINELTSIAVFSAFLLMDTIFVTPVISLGYRYWSSTTGITFLPGVEAWGASFYFGLVDRKNKTDTHYVRPVRGGL